MHWRRKWQPTPVFLPGESQGQGSLVGCRLWGRTESETTEATQQQQDTTRPAHRTKHCTELVGCRPSPSGYRQPELEGGNQSPRETLSTKLQAGFFANSDFLGFWTVNICLRKCTGCTPRKPSGRDGGGDKSQRPRSPNTWSPELLGPGKGTKRRPNQVCASEDCPST